MRHISKLIIIFQKIKNLNCRSNKNKHKTISKKIELNKVNYRKPNVDMYLGARKKIKPLLNLLN